MAVSLNSCDTPTQPKPEKRKQVLPIPDHGTSMLPASPNLNIQPSAARGQAKPALPHAYKLLKEYARNHPDQPYAAIAGVWNSKEKRYSYRSMPLHFPDSVKQAAADTAQLYQYRLTRDHTQAWRILAGLIPSTAGAKKLMDRWLQYPESSKVKELTKVGSLPDTGGGSGVVSKQSLRVTHTGATTCLKDGLTIIFCIHEGVTVTAEKPHEGAESHKFEQGWPSGGGAGDRGGGGSPPPPPPDDPCTKANPPEYCSDIMEITVDNSFKNNPCLSSVYDQAGKASTYNNILKNFEGDFSVANLELSVGVDPNYQNSNAITYGPTNYNILIKFNPNKLSRPSLSIARTLIHELIHAEMYRKLLSVAQKPSVPWSRSFIKSIKNDFPGLYDYYMRWYYNKPDGINAGSPQHQLMAKHYRSIIKEALIEYDDSYSNETYEDLSWVGLQGTVAWNNQGTDTTNIKRAILNFKENSPPCSD